MPFQIDPAIFRAEEEQRLIKYFNTNKLKLAGFENRQRFVY